MKSIIDEIKNRYKKHPITTVIILVLSMLSLISLFISLFISDIINSNAINIIVIIIFLLYSIDHWKDKQKFSAVASLIVSLLYIFIMVEKYIKP